MASVAVDAELSEREAEQLVAAKEPLLLEGALCQGYLHFKSDKSRNNAPGSGGAAQKGADGEGKWRGRFCVLEEDGLCLYRVSSVTHILDSGGQHVRSVAARDSLIPFLSLIAIHRFTAHPDQFLLQTHAGDYWVKAPSPARCDTWLSLIASAINRSHPSAAANEQ